MEERERFDFTLDGQRQYLAYAYKCGFGMLTRTSELSNQENLANSAGDSKRIQLMLKNRAASLEASLTVGALCLGAIVTEAEAHHIGRTHIEDTDGNAVIIDWRARVAEPFYRATYANPQGLNHRWRFICEGQELLDLIDENFLESMDSTTASGIPDPLLAELSRARTGKMRDIVATIQGEQDEVIRRPLDECVVVQGGPGTGKTAIGLHRAAFLLFEHRAKLMDEGILILGPNSKFLEYIGNVLPALGESSAVQTTLSHLLGFAGTGEEQDAKDPLIGDARMSDLLMKALRSTLRPESDINYRFRSQEIVVGAEEIGRFVAVELNSQATWNRRKQDFQDAVLHSAYAKLRGTLASVDFDEFCRESLREGLRTELNRVWPSVSSKSLLQRILRNTKNLRELANGIFTEDETDKLVSYAGARAGAKDLNYQELVFMDEMEFQIRGTGEKFGHVILDEAQDRSALELRAIGRRAKNGSMTILGDLAQATSSGSLNGWDEVVEQLGPRRGSHIIELKVGYRVPEPIMQVANRLLQSYAPHLPRTLSVREAGSAPGFFKVAESRLVLDGIDLALDARKEFSSVAIITSSVDVENVAAQCKLVIESTDQAGMPSALSSVSVHSPKTAKGLEFDAVILLEPKKIFDQDPGGYRALFVALTRAVQTLTVVYSDPSTLSLLGE
jgi:DNA helicase IV